MEAYLDELSHEDKKDKLQELKESSLGKKITPLLARFDELRKTLEMKPNKSPRLITLIRMVACLLYLICWLPVFASCSMLRPLHPFLRKLGVPESNFPLYIVIRLYARGNFEFPIFAFQIRKKLILPPSRVSRVLISFDFSNVFDGWDRASYRRP